MSEAQIGGPNPSISSTLDVDDAFNDTDDDADLPYVFSRDTVRKELERNRPPPLEPWDDDVGSENNTASTTGAFFGDANTSVSTLDITGSNGYAHEGEWTSPTAESPLSSHFSNISLATPAEVHQEAEDSPRLGHPNVGSDTEEAEHPYPNIIIDASKAPSHRVALTSEYKPHSPNPPNLIEKSGSIDAPATTATAFVVPTSSASAPPSQQPTIASPSPVASSSSLPGSSSNTLLHEKPRTHKVNRSGPSAFEKVRSRTRPVFLPPKSRKEDDKHLTDWQNMMKQSRVAAEKRRKALQERRLIRERAIEESLHIWEKEIVPDWRVVFKNPALRKLWWHGIPTKLRASMWEKAIGNPLSLSKDHYRTCLSRAKRALASGAFPKESLEALEEDVRSTLPAIHIFHPDTGPLYDDLKNMLYAWVVARADEGLGYTPGAARIAAMLLINLPIQNAFVVMRNLLERHCMRSFFGGERTREDVEAYYRIFDTLLADGMPKIYFNFKQHQISPSAYLPDWLIPLFLDHLPFEACARIWDVVLLEGDSFLYRAALGILAVLEPRLFFPDRKELLELLKGENKAALEVARRECIPLDGGKYEIYGVDEETLWDRIELMEDWWKESTWTRLIQRELPDL